VSLSCTETWNRVCLFVWASCGLMDHDAGAHEVCKLLDSKEIRLVAKLACFHGRERERVQFAGSCLSKKLKKVFVPLHQHWLHVGQSMHVGPSIHASWVIVISRGTLSPGQAPMLVHGCRSIHTCFAGDSNLHRASLTRASTRVSPYMLCW
jgi:hypothetical protein